MRQKREEKKKKKDWINEKQGKVKIDQEKRKRGNNECELENKQHRDKKRDELKNDRKKEEMKTKKEE